MSTAVAGLISPVCAEGIAPTEGSEANQRGSAEQAGVQSLANHLTRHGILARLIAVIDAHNAKLVQCHVNLLGGSSPACATAKNPSREPIEGSPDDAEMGHHGPRVLRECK
jgi:hypothetical protein